MRLLTAVLVYLMAAFTSAHFPTAGGGGGHKGFSLGIRDSIMIAHSFEGAQFGPAQEVCFTTHLLFLSFTYDLDLVDDGRIKSEGRRFLWLWGTNLNKR